MPKSDPLQDATKTQLSPRQLRSLEALLSQKKGESYQSVADRAGVHRTSLYRYMADPIFFAALNTRIRDEFRLVRIAVNRSLINNATNGDVASQRLFYQLSGLLTETVEFTDSPRNVETIPTIDPDKLTPEAREILWAEVQKFRVANPGENLSTVEHEIEAYDSGDAGVSDSPSPAPSRFTLSCPTDKKNFADPEADLDGIDSHLSGSDSSSNSGSNYAPNLDLFDDRPGTQTETSAVSDVEEF